MIEIIPAIDIMAGKCVRLSQGDYNKQKVYDQSPVETAKQFEDAGLRRLHMVDLDGAKQGKIVNLRSLADVATHTGLQIDFGGGIKTTENVEDVFDTGAAMINIGSIAVKQPLLVEQWINEFGAEKILLGADVKDEKIVINGWQTSTSIDIIGYITDFQSRGIQNIFCTDVSKDGLLQGASIDLYKKLANHFPGVCIIASGGVSSVEDIEALEHVGCSGVIVGKALYEGQIKLNALKKFLS